MVFYLKPYYCKPACCLYYLQLLIESKVPNKSNIYIISVFDNPNENYSIEITYKLKFIPLTYILYPFIRIFNSAILIEELLSNGMSNIKVNSINYNFFTSRLNFDIELPLIDLSAGK